MSIGWPSLRRAADSNGDLIRCMARGSRKVVSYPYITVVEAVRENAKRHMTRSAMHAAAGRLDYADGSAEKANRNFLLASRFDEITVGQNVHADAIIDRIIFGIADSGNRGLL